MQYVQIILAVLQIYKAVKEKGEDDSAIGVIILKLADIIGLDLTPEDLGALAAIVKEIHALRK